MVDVSGRSNAFIAAIVSSCADVNSLSALMKEDHDWRLAHPDRFFAEIVGDLWADVPDSDAQTDFEARAQAVHWWATDVVECLERILTDRPTWAPRILVEATGRGPWLADPSKNPERYFDWLSEQMMIMRVSADGPHPDEQ